MAYDINYVMHMYLICDLKGIDQCLKKWKCIFKENFKNTVFKKGSYSAHYTKINYSKTQKYFFKVIENTIFYGTYQVNIFIS